MDNSEKDNSLEIVEKFVSNIGQVLSKVKDTIVKDILDGLSADNMTWDDFKNKALTDPKEGVSILERFINEIIKKLGYDISNCKSNEIIDLFKSLVSSTLQLQQSLSEIIEMGSKVDWNGLMDKYAESSSDSNFSVTKSLFQDLAYSVNKSSNGTGDGLDIDKIKDLFNQVKNVVSLIKKFSDVEWKNIADDAEGFGEFIKKTYFTENFGKRILDYVLILLLQNTKDVFRDDVKDLIHTVKESGQNLIEGMFEATEAELIECQDEIDAAEAEIADEQEYFRLCSIDNSFEIGYIPTPYLQVRLDEANSKMDALLEKGKVGYNKIARVFKQIYCILDLMGIIEEKTVRLETFIPNEQIRSTFDCSIKIVTLKWNLITKIFTDPLGYLKTVYKIDNISDAQLLLGKIIAVVKAFKGSTVDFNSSDKLVYSLFLKSKGKAEVKGVLDIQKRINVNIKEKIKKDVELYNNGNRNSLLFKIKDDVRDALTERKIDNVVDVLKDDVKNLCFKSLEECVIDNFGETEIDKITKNDDFTQGVVSAVLSAYSSLKNEVDDAVEENWAENFYYSIDSVARASEYLFRDNILEYKQESKTVEIEGFSVDGFLETIQNELVSVLPTDFDYHYESIANAVADLTKKSLSQLQIEDKAEKIVADVMTGLWMSLKTSINGYATSSYVESVGDALNKYRESLFETLPSDTISKGSDFPETLYNIKTWANSTTSIKEILNALDGKDLGIKDMPSLPKFGLDNFKLPNCSFNAKDKFVSVDLCNLSSGDSELKLQLTAFVGKKEIDKGSEKTGVYIIPKILGKGKTEIGIGDNHKLSLNGGFSVNAGGDKDKSFGLFIYSKEKLKLGMKPLFSGEAIKVEASAKFGRTPNNTLQIFSTKVADLSIDDYPLSVFFSYEDDSFDAGVSGAANNLKLLLKLKNQNAFFNKILQKDIEINLEELKLAYTIKKGFSIDGSFYVEIPLETNIEFQGIKFSNICVEIGGKDGDLVAKVCTSFTANLHGFAISFNDLGIGCICNVLDSKGKLGDFNLSPEFKYPTGLGIAIDTSCVTGAGMLNWDKDKVTGAFSLEILEKFGVQTFFLLTMDPFSFAGALNFQFNPGIQLGMGFVLNGIGGSLGINRGLSVDKLRTALYEGVLSSVLFVKDLENNLGKVLENLSVYYPYADNQFYFGFLAQLTWGELLKADLGLFIQGPDLKVIIAGELSIKVTSSSDSLLSINVSFMGGIELSKGLFFDASIHDSKLVGLNLEGDMALRIYWAGSTKGFILSVGGFHPDYQPPKGFDLPAEMKRLSIGLKYSFVKMSLQAYFAITSNTVQFGARVDIKAESHGWGISGYLFFDALFQFKPFYFKIKTGAGVTLKAFGRTLLSVRLSFELSGPAQWNAKGTAYVKILFFEVGVDFDVTWGKKQNDSQRELVKVYSLFYEEWNKSENWETISSDDSGKLVYMLNSKNQNDIVCPSDLISFSQCAVPLNTDMERYGEKEIDDYRKIEISSVTIGDETPTAKREDSASGEYKLNKDSFAPSLIKNLTDDEKLAASSYKDMDSGFKLGNNFDVKNSENIKNVTYDVEEIWDDQSKSFNTNEWQQLYASLSGDKSAKKNKASKSLTKKTDLAYSRVINLNDKFVTRMPSARRDASGFKQYINNLDKCIVESLNKEKVRDGE